MMTTQDKRNERKLLTKWKTTKNSDRISVEDQFKAYHQWLITLENPPAVHVFPGSKGAAYFGAYRIPTIPVENTGDYK